MRQVGTLPSKQDADRFSDYLLAQGISSKTEPADGHWTLWIRDENQVSRSRQELERFLAAPQDPRYRAAEHEAKQARQLAAKRQRQAQKNYVDLRQAWDSPWRRRPVTVAMIAISVLLWFGRSEISVPDFLFSMPHILDGEVWRLVTPIFLHATVLHLVFNMWWLYDLGTLIEQRLGWYRFAGLVLVIAIASNGGQYTASGPNFYGMSGVVYGLFGYAWVRGRLDPTSGMYLRPDIAFWMMVWFAACAIGLIGNVANWAHGVGLATGAALGYLPQVRRFLHENT